MLNEDELRDAILLVFANKQDLPVRRCVGAHVSTMPDADHVLECHERGGDHRQAWPPQPATTCLGKSRCRSCRPSPLLTGLDSTSNRPAPPLAMVSTRVWSGLPPLSERPATSKDAEHRLPGLSLGRPSWFGCVSQKYPSRQIELVHTYRILSPGWWCGLPHGEPLLIDGHSLFAVFSQKKSIVFVAGREKGRTGLESLYNLKYGD